MTADSGPAESEQDSERRCPECDSSVPAADELTAGVYLCRGCMKAVRIDEDGDPDGKGDLFTDGGGPWGFGSTDGRVEEIELDPRPDSIGLRLTVETTGRTLDLYQDRIELSGMFEIPTDAAERLIAHLYPTDEVSDCVICGDPIPNDSLNAHYRRKHPREYTREDSLGDADTDTDREENS